MQIPVYVVTGFLDAGKTSLLNRLLNHRAVREAMWLSELSMNLDQYEGYRITMKGFVFRDKQTMKANEFVPARLMMSCCAADLAPCGFICIYDNASGLKADSWVLVEGIVHKGQFEGYDEPQIAVTRVSPAEKVEEYIYP